MFVQLRRVVFLLVLLQCCACVAYGESSEEVIVTVQNTRSAGEYCVTTKMNGKLQEFNITAAELFANGYIAFSVLDMNVQTLQDLSEVVNLFAEATEQLLENISKPVTPVSEGTDGKIESSSGPGDSDSGDTRDEGPTELMVKDVKYMIKSVAETSETVRLAIGYCKNWSDILDELIDYCGKPTGEHILSESVENLLAVEPQTKYEYLYLLKAYIRAATKRGNDTVEVVKKHEKVVEDALDKLNVSNDTLKEEFRKIREDAEKNSTTAFKEILKEHKVETMFVESAKEYEETPDQIRNKDQPGEDSIIAERGTLQPPSAPQTATEAEPQAPAAPPSVSQQEASAETQAPQETSSLESEETSTADLQIEKTVNTAETDSRDAATPTTTPTPTPTTPTTAAAPIEAKKKGLQNTASGPMSSTAVLLVLALTVSTVIGMTVV